MVATPAYDELIDFIVSEADPMRIIAFQPSQAANDRVEELLFKEKESALTPDEKLELDHYLLIEHLMRIAKSRARQILKEAA
jgi:hypothetical protein